MILDVRKAPAYGRLRHLAPVGGYLALLAAPLRGSADPAGVIVGYSVTARQFSGPEVELIELLGSQATMALETARLRAAQGVAGQHVARGYRPVLHRHLEPLRRDKRYVTDFRGPDESASEWIARRQVKTFGVDSPTPDNPASTSYPVHVRCGPEHITHYENLANLD